MKNVVIIFLFITNNKNENKKKKKSRQQHFKFENFLYFVVKSNRCEVIFKFYVCLVLLNSLDP